MPVLGVNMAIPITTNLHKSQIYILPSLENTVSRNLNIDKKYLVFKTLEMILSLCALVLFVYSMRATENEILDMFEYIVLGAVTVYPILFILLSMRTNTKPIFVIVLNLLAGFSILVISGSNMSSAWTKARHFYHANYKEKYFESLMELRSSILISATGILYAIESLIMYFGIRSHDSNNR